MQQVEVAREPARKEQWVAFYGTAVRTGDWFVLRPHEDPMIEIYMSADNVATEGSPIVVRVGARAILINIPTSSPVPIMKNLSTHPSCVGQTSCLGRVETCCDDNRILGSCGGGWRCR